MQNTFGLEIYAANRQFFSGRAQSLIIPAEDGQKEFLAHHANMICAIVPGELRFQDAEGNWEVVAVSSGFVEMINNRAKLFCLTVERPEEIDIRRAEEARDRAEEQLRQQQINKNHGGYSYEKQIQQAVRYHSAGCGCDLLRRFRRPGC